MRCKKFVPVAGATLLPVLYMPVFPEVSDAIGPNAIPPLAVITPVAVIVPVRVLPPGTTSVPIVPVPGVFNVVKVFVPGDVMPPLAVNKPVWVVAPV